MLRFGKVALVLILLAGAAAPLSAGYMDAVITNTSPVIYWDIDHNNGTAATDQATAGGLTSGVTDRAASFGGAGSGLTGFSNLSSGNIGVTLNNQVQGPTNNGGAAVLNDPANTLSSAGIGMSDYSAMVWFNSSVGFGTHTLNYLFSRGNDLTTSGLQDLVAVGGAGGWESQLLYFDGSSYVAAGTTTLAPNTWYQMVFTRHNSDLDIYLDGTVEVAATHAAAAGNGDRISFGNRLDYTVVGATVGLTGSIDEVAVWNRALSSTEVSNLYQYASVPEPSTMVLLVSGLLGLLAYAWRKRR